MGRGACGCWKNDWKSTERSYSVDSDVLFLPQGQEEVLPVSARADPSNGYVKGNRFMSDVQPKGYEMVSSQSSLVYHLVHCHHLLLLHLLLHSMPPGGLHCVLPTATDCSLQSKKTRPSKVLHYHSPSPLPEVKGQEEEEEGRRRANTSLPHS